MIMCCKVGAVNMEYLLETEPETTEYTELTGELIFMDDPTDMFIHEDWLIDYDY